jgi:hypothetical protein
MTVILTHMVELKHFFFALNHLLKKKCIILQSLLIKLNIKSTLKERENINNNYRIRISKTSTDRVIFLVKPYMHIDFLYKIGI